MTRSNKKAPLGVMIVSAIDAFSIGLMPLIMLYIITKDGHLTQILGLNPFGTISTLILSLAIFVAAYKTYKRNEKAKKTLIILVALYLVLVGFNNISVMLNPQQLGIEQLTSEQTTKLISNIVRPAILLLINIFYFRSEKAQEFFAN